MAFVRCTNCDFAAYADWDGGIATCPECCGRLHVDGGFERPAPSPRRVRKRLAVTQWAPSEARRALFPLLAELGGEAGPAVELLVSELITNSVRHSAKHLKGTITLEVREAGGRWRVEVEDDGPGFEPSGRAGDQDLGSGWGLFLVDRFAEAWGVERERDRTRVWCEVTAGAVRAESAGRSAGRGLPERVPA